MNTRVTELPEGAVHNSDSFRLAPPAPAVREIMEEFEAPARVASLEAELEKLEGIVDRAVQEADTAAAASVAEHPSLTVMKESGSGLRERWARHDEQARRIETNPALSAEGRRIEREEARTHLDGEIEKLRGSLATRAELLRQAYGQPEPAPLSQGDTYRALLLAVQFRDVPPDYFLGQAVGAVREALKGGNVAYLESGVLPLLRRRAESPEKFAAAYSQVAGKTLDLATRFLGTRGAAHNLAVELAERAEREFSWVVAMARSAGSWPRHGIIESGSPFFSW